MLGNIVQMEIMYMWYGDDESTANGMPDIFFIRSTDGGANFDAHQLT